MTAILRGELSPVAARLRKHEETHGTRDGRHHARLGRMRCGQILYAGNALDLGRTHIGLPGVNAAKRFRETGAIR